MKTFESLKDDIFIKLRQRSGKIIEKSWKVIKVFNLSNSTFSGEKCIIIKILLNIYFHGGNFRKQLRPYPDLYTSHTRIDISKLSHSAFYIVKFYISILLICWECPGHSGSSSCPTSSSTPPSSYLCGSTCEGEKDERDHCDFKATLYLFLRHVLINKIFNDNEIIVHWYINCIGQESAGLSLDCTQ